MNEKIIHKLETKEEAKLPQANKQKIINLVILIAIVLTAIFSSKQVVKILVSSSNSLPDVSYSDKTVSMGAKELGQKNIKLCPDTAEGILKSGGIEGEGTHHLVRKGGEDQYVYLTSSTIDLSQVVNKKVKVWGKTYTAKTAGWLMDACYLEIK